MINPDVLRLLDNNGKLLYVLYEHGNLRFEEIVQLLCPTERLKKAVSKYEQEIQDPKKHIPMKKTVRSPTLGAAH